jgi:hypothetical protein|tara:strand:+ start:366 stop:794 length:429 start_codon:yes stop_codon:yes gene_type:complete
MAEGFDVELLMKSLERDENDCIMDLDSAKIQQINNDMLQQLRLPREKLKKMNKTLKQYRFVDEIPDIKYGAYVRWINLNTSELKLTNGGIICDIKIVNDDVMIVCRNTMGRFFQFKLNECLAFQKITDQEKVLLSALDYLKT